MSIVMHSTWPSNSRGRPSKKRSRVSSVRSSPIQNTLEEQREARVLVRPRRRGRLDPAVGAVRARQRGADLRLELAGVQVAPRAFLAVLDDAAGSAADWAGQGLRRIQFDPHGDGLASLSTVTW